MSRSEKIKFAVVGFGHIGKRHAAIVTQHGECQLCALCEPKPKAALAEIDKYDVPVYPSLTDLLRDGPEVDIVSICTPNGLHARQALEALEARKHVVIEKPMALRRVDCERIIHRALNVGRQVFCVMQNRYSPPVRWLKEIIDAGRLGEVFLVQINCFWNRDDRYYNPGGNGHTWHGTRELDGGTLYTQFAHFIDILYWVFGDIEVLNTRLEDFNHEESTDFEDSGTVHFRLNEGGGMGSLVFSTAVWDHNFESTITVLGSKGTIKIGGQYMDRVEYCHARDFRMPSLPATEAPNSYAGYQGSAANHHFVIQNVVDVLQGHKETTTNALEGMKVVDMIERIYSAANVRF